MEPAANNASEDQSLNAAFVEEGAFSVSFFQKRKHHKYRSVEAPRLEGPVADTHAHIQMLKFPENELARCAFHNVRFVCAMTDPCDRGEDGEAEGAEAQANGAAEVAAGAAFEAGVAEVAVGTSPLDAADEAGFAIAEAAVEVADDAKAFVAGGSGESAAAAAPSVAGHADTSWPTFRNLEKWQEGARQLLQANGLSEYAGAVPQMRIAVGVHPHNASSWNLDVERLMLRRLADPRVCALGEVGLDYFYDISPRAAQRGVFRRQIQLAKLAGLPLILHMREAHSEGLAILEDEGFPAAGVLLHCFNLDEEALAPWAEHGCFIAYGGPLTFKKADEVRAAAVKVPHNRLLTETDSPYMTPEPMRGVDCGPAHVVFTAEKMLEVLGCETAEQRTQLLEQVYNNALGLLNRQPTEWQQREWAKLQGRG
jgi:TatD DNase family protein